MEREIQVSIVCNAYNHEKYIRDALEGFLMQETRFPFEVLIHDDASTDGTADIIREYEGKYPAIIKPIYQTVNQYSKKINISIAYQYPRAQGRYIAFCEGDDFWTAPDKLQKQFDALEAHPEIDICAHASTTISATNGEILRYNLRLQEDGVIPVQRVIEGGGSFVASASLFYRKEIMDHLPEFRRKCNLDYIQQIYGSLRGGMYYLCDNMSVYRSGVPNSSTQRLMQDMNKRIANGNRVYQALRQLDRDTDRKYHGTILKCLMRNRTRQIAYHLVAFKRNCFGK